MQRLHFSTGFDFNFLAPKRNKFKFLTSFVHIFDCVKSDKIRSF